MAPTTSPSQAPAGSSMSFQTAVVQAMNCLAKDPHAIFVGQSLKWDGAAIFHSLEGVPLAQREEFPVAENLQLGYCTGLSLMGRLPICIYPRMDFLLLAMDQLVNHLDKLPTFGWKPKVIIRCRVGQKTPLDAGPQHTQNHTKALYSMLETVKVLEVCTPAKVEWAYNEAIKYELSTLIVENPSGE